MKKYIIPIILLLLIMTISSCRAPRVASAPCSYADILRGQQLLKMSMSNLQSEEPASAKILIIDALHIFKVCNEYYWEGVAYEYYGYACLMDGNKIQAVSYFAKASDIYHTLNYPIDNSRFDLEKLMDKLQYTSGILEGETVTGAVNGGKDEAVNGRKSEKAENINIKECLEALDKIEKRLEELMMTISHK